MTLDDDIDAILGDGPDIFVAGDVAVQTTFLEHDAVDGETAGAAGVICGEGYVLLRASQFVGLAEGDAVMVNATAYRVSQQPMRIQDGRVLQVFLGSV